MSGKAFCGRSGATSPEAEPTPPLERTLEDTANGIRACIVRYREAVQAVYERTDLLGELIRAGGKKGAVPVVVPGQPDRSPLVTLLSQGHHAGTSLWPVRRNGAYS